MPLYSICFLATPITARARPAAVATYLPPVMIDAAAVSLARVLVLSPKRLTAAPSRLAVRGAASPAVAAAAAIAPTAAPTAPNTLMAASSGPTCTLHSSTVSLAKEIPEPMIAGS